MRHAAKIQAVVSVVMEGSWLYMWASETRTAHNCHISYDKTHILDAKRKGKIS